MILRTAVQMGAGLINLTGETVAQKLGFQSADRLQRNKLVRSSDHSPSVKAIDASSTARSVTFTLAPAKGFANM